jgi:hypothetical protein
MVPAPLGPWGGAKTTQNLPVFKNLLLYNRTCGGKTECMVMESKKASTKIVKFIILGVAVLPPGEGKHDI